MRIRTSLTALGLTAALALVSCAETTSQSSGQVAASVPVANPVPAKVETVQIFNDVYGPVTDAGYALPAIPINRVNEKFRRQIVEFQNNERPGTIIVNTRERFLYYILPGNRAVRYGIGVGKAGFAW